MRNSQMWLIMAAIIAAPHCTSLQAGWLVICWVSLALLSELFVEHRGAK